MKPLRARQLFAACGLASALGAGALAAGPTGAYAAATQCSGANITGQGANVMTVAYTEIFDPQFNKSTNAAACSGTQGSKAQPTVSYTSSSSGTGLASWGVGGKFTGFGTSNAFVVTEEPPNATDKSEIEADESTPGSATESLLTIPVAQEAIPILIHLPAECQATSTAFEGRLVLTNEDLQKIFLGTLTKWSEIQGGGDKLTGAGCESTITKIVRYDSAGSTHILKKYLNLINSSPFATANGQQTWDDLSEGAGNTVWPTAAEVKTPGKKGDTAEVAAVASTPGSIGYSSLANARANSAFVPPAGGRGEPTFWAPVQNDGTGTKKETFSDPSTDAETSAPADANCAKEKYTNGQGAKFPPKSTQEVWSEVTTATKQKNYTLCGIAYQLAFTKYSAYPGTTEQEETTVSNFLTFVLANKNDGGQNLIENHDYEALPKTLVKEAQQGAALIGF